MNISKQLNFTFGLVLDKSIRHWTQLRSAGYGFLFLRVPEGGGGVGGGCNEACDSFIHS
jgi:hypothetical protein